MMSLFSLFSREAAEKRRETHIEKETADKLRKRVEQLFGKDIQTCRKLFSTPPQLEKDDAPGWHGIFLSAIGVNAFIYTINISAEYFPVLMTLVKQGQRKVELRHFERGSEGTKLRTIVATKSRFFAVEVSLLTNDTALLKSIYDARFGPPPPWVVLFERGALCGYAAEQSEWDAAYWLNNIWDLFWNRLSLEEQNQYIADWRAKTKSYISNEDWEELIFMVRMRDPRYAR